MIDNRWIEYKIEGKNIQARSYHSAVVYNDAMYIYGGYDAQKGILSDMYSLSLTKPPFQWTLV